MFSVARPAVRWIVRIVAGLVALVALALIAGAAYQALAGNVDESRYPPFGTLVDIGGRRLHLSCTGQGASTVILDAGLGMGAITWRHVQPALSADLRVCSYDRAGFGWSDTGPSPRSSTHITNDLHQLLDRASVQRPFVLAGHSLGGLFARHYAAMYPSDVSGLVLIDSSHEDQSKPGALARTLVPLAVNSGLHRLFYRFGDPGLDAVYTSNKTIEAMKEEFAGIVESSDAVRNVHLSLQGKPLGVVTAGQNDTDVEWHRLQLDLLTRSASSKRIVAGGSSHIIQDDRPDIVISAIRDVVARSR